VAWCQAAALDQLLHVRGQLKKAQRVSDIGTRAPCPRGDSGDGAARLRIRLRVELGLQPTRLLKRTDGSVNVMLADDRISLVGAEVLSNDDRDVVPPCPAGRHPHLRAAQDLVSTVADRTNHDGIDGAVAPNALDELGGWPGYEPWRSGLAKAQQINRKSLGHSGSAEKRVT
jgi:hypothetical protein